MEYFVISTKFVPLKYYTLSSQLQRLTSFSVGCSGWRILSPGQIAVMRKWSIVYFYHEFKLRHLKNQKLFSIRVNELFEPIILRRKGDGFLLFLKAFS